MIELGNKVIVTDPCYSLGTWCTAVIEDVLPGKYETGCEMSDEGNWGNRVAEIIAIHEKYGLNHYETLNWKMTEDDIGVDSGQAGIFDYEHYKSEKEKDEEFESTHSCEIDNPNWHYGRCCIATNDSNKTGEIDNKGYVSQSGFGDGSYDLYIGRDDDQNIVGFRLVFINGEEDDEY